VALLGIKNSARKWWATDPEGDGGVFYTDDKGFAEYTLSEYFGEGFEVAEITQDQIDAADAAYNGGN
jgi:hypothetical protein